MTGQELREYRLSIGLSQSSLAQCIGVTEKDIKAMEAGSQTVPANLENKANVYLKVRGRS